MPLKINSQTIDLKNYSCSCQKFKEWMKYMKDEEIGYHISIDKSVKQNNDTINTIWSNYDPYNENVYLNFSYNVSKEK